MDQLFALFFSPPRVKLRTKAAGRRCHFLYFVQRITSSGSFLQETEMRPFTAHRFPSGCVTFAPAGGLYSKVDAGSGVGRWLR